jgi:hypothetical protein
LAVTDPKQFVVVGPTDTTETLRRKTENFSARYELRFNTVDFPNSAPLADRRWARYFDAVMYGELMRAELFRRRRTTIRATEIAVGDGVVVDGRLYTVAAVAGESTRVVVDFADPLAARCFPKMNLEDSLERNSAFSVAMRREFQPRQLVAVERLVRLAR